jgi:transcriptional regulator with XRE-family HTH domain
LDVRTLLDQRGFTPARAERELGLHRGYLSRALSGRRGWPCFLAIIRLADGTGIPLGHMAEAFRCTIEARLRHAKEVRAAELARLRAELE